MLRNLAIAPRTEERYNSALGHLLPVVEQASDLSELDLLAEEWIEAQWTRGTPLGLIGDALCGLQHHWPQVKGYLRGAWKLYKSWRRIEVPQRAPPLPKNVCLALVGLFLDWGEATMAFLVALAFHTFLRTGEILNLSFRDVQLSRHGGAVTVRRSKTGLRFNIDEAVAIHDTGLWQLWGLLHLPRAQPPSALIWSKSGQAFRSLFYKGLDALKLQSLKFQPYSLRRGGATHTFVGSQRLDEVLLRWRSIQVARLYLQDGQSQLSQLQISSASRALLASAMRGLPPHLCP